MKEIIDSLYYVEVKLLTTYCKNCLDSKMKDKIMLFLFKKTLLDTATALDLQEDADMYYNELINLLDMKTCSCDIINNKCCENGYCQLCK